MYEGEALLACMMVSYAIDFAAILRFDLQDRVFGEFNNHQLPCMI